MACPLFGMSAFGRSASTLKLTYQNISKDMDKEEFEEIFLFYFVVFLMAKDKNWIPSVCDIFKERETKKNIDQPIKLKNL